MSIAIIFNNKDTNPWEQKLKELLPETKVEVYPNISNFEEVTFLLCWKPERNVVSKFPNVKLIQSVGASIDHITNTQTLNDSIEITRIIDHNLNHDMWEFLLSIVSAELKNLNFYQQQKELSNWKPIFYRNFKDVTISIMGLGQIGSYVAQKFAELGFVVKGWSNSEKSIPNVSTFAEKDSLIAFLRNTDFLINILPFTESTENILDKNVFQTLKKGAFLINVGRGEHLNENDLTEALTNEQLAGAYLDVFREEPLPQSHPFWTNPKISITPHIASITNLDSAAEQVVANFKAHVAGEKIQNTVSIKKGY
jgi:glyoxylate/hydroxypyruvate reductase